MKKYFVLFLFFAATSAWSRNNGVNLISLSCQQIRAFVDGHNHRRLQVAKGNVAGQPPASEMKMMVWDEELQAKASQWAKKNLGTHNPNRSVGSNRFSTGENLYWYSITDPKYVLDPEAALESWFEENVNYTFGPIKNSDLSRRYHILHYTQMVWSETDKLGCAISQTFERRHSYTLNKFFVVCNYGPTGNYPGEKPYEESFGRGNQLVCDTQNNCDRPYGLKC